MHHRKRIIPSLLIINDGIYKTTKFKEPIYIGDPLNIIKIFNEKEVDELLLLDINASKNKSGPNFSLIRDIASECFMPLTYGGGISSIEDVQKLFKIGVEKILIQSNLVNTSLIKEITCKYGSQSIVASLNFKKNIFGKYVLYDYINRKINSKISFLDYIKDLECNGVGEILINLVDLDGTMLGPNFELINLIVNSTNLPVIYSGGIGSYQDINKLFKVGVSGVGVGALFCFYGPHKAVLISYPCESDLKSIYNE